MRHKPLPGANFFFSTAPLPCPYFPDRVETRVVTELIGRNAESLHYSLTLAGFRRSHTITYAPTCPECDACRSVRVCVNGFAPSRSQRRVQKRNNEITAEITPAIANEEQYAIFSSYQASRHGDGDMAKMEYGDYQALVEETEVETKLVEFRRADGTLIACCLVDRMSGGLSAVYSYYDVGVDPRLSIGTYIILWLIERAKSEGLDYVYLGFWIENCVKMDYKSGFRPLQVFTPDGWRELP
ncbi:MAG: arginyltransferase [Rhodospirillaceae bacterium]|nr:arginyltransferase [Rhodospirillaceae bacterium]